MVEQQKKEWLITDQLGAFAMGTLDGIRTRKYHGFFMGVAGRSEKGFLADLDIECNGKWLWPHTYAGPEGPVRYPDPQSQNVETVSTLTDTGPEWQWNLPEGKLTFSVSISKSPRGISLNWHWSSKGHKKCRLRVRSFWALRELHHLGGRTWRWVHQDATTHPGGSIVSDLGTEAHCMLDGDWVWIEDPQWYQNFYYTEEIERGYPAQENLFSAGILEIELKSGETSGWVLTQNLDLGGSVVLPFQGKKSPIYDFVLFRPAGIVAGFPWFGEWGRDTFIALPGVVGSCLRDEKSPEVLWTWVKEVMRRWGTWIERQGMIPNVLEKSGQIQWESADATLWWCHSLAVLWAHTQAQPFPFSELKEEFEPLLRTAIQSIRSGHHRFLRETREGLLEVTEPHTTWMDARIDGNAVTPRTGLLPEINALWFEARCLEILWSESRSLDEIERLGHLVLACQEPDRPNSIFLHSLILAPSFVLNDQESLARDLQYLKMHFWTPVGLRTLRPDHPNYIPHCKGDQCERDKAYHQGSPWGWLAGHYEMARQRLLADGIDLNAETFPSHLLERMPIRGHIPELFDAEVPFIPRGTPAQAWSLACLEEAKVRRRMKLDTKVSRILAQRWLGRKERKLRKMGKEATMMGGGE